MKCKNQKITNDYAIYNGDSVELMQEIPVNSIDYSIYSPPFQSLYVFSDSDRDLSNCNSDNEFWIHYKFMIKEKLRITKQGRLTSVHCINLPMTINRNGYIGIDDFRGKVIKAHQDAGFIFHSEVVIWKDPVVSMQRSKAIGLLHKQVKKDSSISRMGMPDYIVTFRKPGENMEKIKGRFDSDLYAGEMSLEKPREIGTDYDGNKFIRSEDNKKDWDSINVWQNYASPVWFDIRQGNVLNRTEGRHSDDEKHITPLQLDVIDRCLQLWSKEGDTVFTPFMGIGSEIYMAIKRNRKGFGIELKESYFNLAVKNIDSAINERDQLELF